MMNKNDKNDICGPIDDFILKYSKEDFSPILNKKINFDFDKYGPLGPVKTNVVFDAFRKLADRALQKKFQRASAKSVDVVLPAFLANALNLPNSVPNTQNSNTIRNAVALFNSSIPYNGVEVMWMPVGSLEFKATFWGFEMDSNWLVAKFDSSSLLRMPPIHINGVCKKRKSDDSITELKITHVFFREPNGQETTIHKL